MAQLNGTQSQGDGAATIPALLLAHVARHGDETIIRRKERGIWKTTSWQQLGEQVRNAAMALKAFGFRSGEVACVLAPTTPDWVVIDLGVQSAGGLAAGLYSTDAADLVSQQLKDCNCRIVFVGGEEQLDTVLAIREHCPALSKIVYCDGRGLREFSDPMCESLQAFLASGDAYAAAHAGAFESGIAALDPNQGAAMLFTAGTAGPSKSVRLSHQAILSQTRKAAALLGQQAGDERLAFLPMPHFMERVLGLYQALVTRTISNYAEGPDSVADNLREVMPTVFVAPPRIWELYRAKIVLAAAEATFLQRAMFNWAIRGGPFASLILSNVRRRLGLDRLRVAGVGGAQVSPALIDWYRKLGINLSEFYGLSETGGLAMAMASDRSGSTSPCAELKISDAGELLVRDPGIFAQGWSRDGRSDAVSDGAWLSTGDAARMDNGAIRVTGRLADAIAAPGGAMISPSALEAELKFSPYIADALVVAGPNRALGALIAIEHESIERWAQKQRIVFAGLADLARSDSVRDLLQAEIARVNAASVAPIASFRVIEQRLEPEDPELTPMMTLRRRYVSEKYRDLIQAMA